MSLEDSLIRLAVTGDREAQRLVYESLRDSIGGWFRGLLTHLTLMM
jgi:hypothetical protein